MMLVGMKGVDGAGIDQKFAGQRSIIVKDAPPAGQSPIDDTGDPAFDPQLGALQIVLVLWSDGRMETGEGAFGKRDAAKPGEPENERIRLHQGFLVADEQNRNGELKREGYQPVE